MGPASIISMRFDSIIRSMNDEELMNCVELLGSFDLNPDLARYIWSKTKDKVILCLNVFKASSNLYLHIDCFTHLWFCIVWIIV